MIVPRHEMKEIAGEVADSLLAAAKAGVLQVVGKTEVEAAVSQRTDGLGWSADQLFLLDEMTIRAVVEKAFLARVD